MSARELGILAILDPKEYKALVRVLGRVVNMSSWPAAENLRQTSSATLPDGYRNTAEALWSLHPRDLPLDIRVAFRTYLKGRLAIVLLEGILPALMRRQGIMSNLRNPALQRSSRQYASFIGLFALFYRILNRLFIHLHGHMLSAHPDKEDKTKGGQDFSKDWRALKLFQRLLERTKRAALSPAVPPFLAAALTSGPLLCILSSAERRVLTAVYVLTRAGQFGWEALSQAGWVKSKEERKWFGSWLLFPLSSAQLIHAYIYDYDCFPQSYGKFIENRSQAYLPEPLPGYEQRGQSTWPAARQIIDSLRILTENKVKPYPGLTSALIRPSADLLPSVYDPELSRPGGPLAASSVVLATAHAEHSRAICALLHPTDPSCQSTFWRYAAREWVSAFKFMAIVYTLSLSVQWRKLVKRPEQTIIHTISNTIKGATFISGAIGVAWSSICAFQQILPAKFMPTSRHYLSGFLAGLLVLLDRGRAQELGLFNLRLALVSAWAVAVKRRRVKSIRHGESIYFSLATGLVMALYECKPSAIKSHFSMALLKQIVGPSRHTLGESS